MFWHPLAPQLFHKEDIRKHDFRIKTIADVSCDVDGSCPLTVKATFSEDPVFGFSPITMRTAKPYQPEVIDVMAVGNLPNELPRDASKDFGKVMLDVVIPALLNKNEMIERATIIKAGKLMERFAYLKEYAGVY